MIAQFSFDRPSGTKVPLKGILVLTPPSQSDGRWFIEIEPWVSFAREHHLLLVGCYFRDECPFPIEDYCRVSNGSGDALLSAIDRYGKENKIPGVSGLPIYMWGFSAGGQFNYEFACAYPQRVAAFVVNKGGVYYSAMASEATRKIPGLFFIGTKDDSWRQLIVLGIYYSNKRFGANWTLVREEGLGHEPGNSTRDSLQFFGEVIRG